MLGCCTAPPADESLPAMAKGEKSELLNGGDAAARHRRTTVWGATAILGTFSTTSSNVMYPWTYGRLGVVLGPLLGVTFQAFMLMRKPCRTLTLAAFAAPCLLAHRR